MASISSLFLKKSDCPMGFCQAAKVRGSVAEVVAELLSLNPKGATVDYSSVVADAV